MPDMGGLEFYRQNVTSYGRPKYPVLFLTARDSLEAILEEVGADGFLSKPFEMVDLIAAVERIISAQKNNDCAFKFLAQQFNKPLMWRVPVQCLSGTVIQFVLDFF